MVKSILAYHQRWCATGKESSCKRAATMEQADKYAKHIEELGNNLPQLSIVQNYETDNKPELERAYFDVMSDFFAAEAGNGVRPAVPNQVLALCASH